MNLSLSRRLQVWAFRILLAVLSLLSVFRPKPLAPGPVTRHFYGTRRDESLEVIAANPAATPREAVIYVHGGGWIAGSKELYTTDLYFLAEQGHTVFNLEYPLAPENPHPAILRSLLTALEWIHKNHGVTHAHFMGDSAGGNLVTMLGLLAENPDRLADLGDGAPAQTGIACLSVVSIYGVLDRLSWIEKGFPGARAMLESYGGRAAFEPQVTPDLAITPMDLDFTVLPPLYLCGASKDQLCESTRLFAERVKGSAREVQVEIFEGEQHGFFNMSWRRASQELRGQILGFIARHEPDRGAAAAAATDSGEE